jgi:hypothetical protein
MSRGRHWFNRLTHLELLATAARAWLLFLRGKEGELAPRCVVAVVASWGGVLLMGTFMNILETLFRAYKLTIILLTVLQHCCLYQQGLGPALASKDVYRNLWR